MQKLFFNLFTKEGFGFIMDFGNHLHSYKPYKNIWIYVQAPDLARS